MRPKERIKFFVFLFLRASVAFVDLLAILAIGYLATASAMLLTGSNITEQGSFLGQLNIPSIDIAQIPFISACVLLLFIVKAASAIFLTHRMAHFLAGVEARAAKLISKRAFGEGLESARHHSREEVHFAVQVGSPAAFNLLLNAVGTLVAEGFLFVLVVGAFILVDPVLAISALMFFSLLGILIQVFLGRQMHGAAVKITQSTVAANSGLSDLAEVVREAAMTGRQDFFYEKIYSSRLKAASSKATSYVLSGMPRYLVETFLIIAIFAFILIESMTSDLVSSAAALGVFLSGGFRLTGSLLPLQNALLTIKESIPSSSGALDLLEIESEVNSPAKKYQDLEKAPEAGVSVVIHELSFTYERGNKEVIRNVSLEVQAGSQVAFIGSSGSGKSTLADLILGLMRPSNGSVLINGVPAQHQLKNNPGLMGYVPQKPGIVSGTILENIALGIEPKDIDLDRLRRAIFDSNLTEFIDSLPQGVNTKMGKRHDELSGGQLQRIGLARALYTQPKLLVMDEATSALDAESEAQINKALDAVRGKMTVILIAHRLNTIQKSDKIFMVDQGSISASGTFNSLLETNSTLKTLVTLMAIDSSP
jgi:ATP-binding cassette subfamily C protein